jgi:uncharacterized membrane protein YeaQ/YmgE (transglycosylase-associated protein family)
MGIFMAAYPLMGVDGLFEPGTYEAARGWILLSIGIGLVAAMAGGAVCARIAPATPAPLWLAAIVLVLGALMAIPVVMETDPARGGVRPANVSMSEAMAHARQPVWVALLNPILGAAGVLMGAGPRAPRRA